jgi:hypothetical protein
MPNTNGPYRWLLGGRPVRTLIAEMPCRALVWVRIWGTSTPRKDGATRWHELTGGPSSVERERWLQERSRRDWRPLLRRIPRPGRNEVRWRSPCPRLYMNHSNGLQLGWFSLLSFSISGYVPRQCCRRESLLLKTFPARRRYPEWKPLCIALAKIRAIIMD